MPTTYTHDLFGKMVYRQLEPQLQKRILQNKELFQIGLHGPDILFYYMPFHKNPVSMTGSRLHWEEAADFFLQGKELYRKEGEEEILIYLLGFLCHFMLDSTCHPYIREYQKEHSVSHDAIETDLDRHLMEVTGRDPFSYKPAKVLKATRKNVKVISGVLKEVPEFQITLAIKSLKFFTGITVGGSFKRSLLLKISDLLGIHTLAAGRILLEEPYPDCEESTMKLTNMMRNAVPETAALIREFTEDSFSSDSVSQRFHRNYE